MIRLPSKAIFYLGSIILLIFILVSANNYMLKKGYEQIEALPADWPGAIIGKGKACKSDRECGDCGFSKATLPKGIFCQCLPAYMQCGLGRLAKKSENKAEE